MLSSENVSMFGLSPQTQVVARSILAVFLGVLLMVFAHSPLVTVASGVTLMLIADGALGLVLYRRVALAGDADDPWSVWLRPLWSVNLGIGLLMLLAITLQQRPIAVVVMAVVTAITTGVWFITLLHSEARLQRALLIWAALLFLSAAALPVVWTLQLTPLDAWSPRLLGLLKVVLGLLMLLMLRRSWATT
ncbi:hypothetical protein [Deinococcus sp. QL22]|uniref:hypothetical protein n=1 Tax=Deinococcus sp. QL22 TaxID=2939437 RepID=UPI002018292E|nr:hypothetical protein [Deinococcus sp. QL22]UQN08276.1 hypothetical protein M1R55_16175 [Deinococcus sp. QL22]